MATYTSYDDLADFNDDHAFKTTGATAFFQTQLAVMMQEIDKKEEEWAVTFEALDILRAVNKYYTADLVENLDMFADFTRKGVESLRSSIIKNSLTFICELFANKSIIDEVKYHESLMKFSDVVFGAVLAKTTYDKVFIAKEAKNAVQVIMENWPTAHTFWLLEEHGIKKSNNKKLVEESHVTYTTQFVASIKRDGPLALDLSEESGIACHLTKLLADSMDAPPRIKKQAAENIKKLRVKVLERHDGKEEDGEGVWESIVKKATVQGENEAASEAKFKAALELSKPTAAKKPAAKPAGKGGLRDFLKNKKKAAPAEGQDVVVAEVIKE